MSSNDEIARSFNQRFDRPIPKEVSVGRKTYTLADFADPLATFLTHGHLACVSAEAAKLVAELEAMPRGLSTERDNHIDALTEPARYAWSIVASHASNIEKARSHGEWLNVAVRLCSESNISMILIAKAIGKM